MKYRQEVWTELMWSLDKASGMAILQQTKHFFSLRRVLNLSQGCEFPIVYELLKFSSVRVELHEVVHVSSSRLQPYRTGRVSIAMHAYLHVKPRTVHRMNGVRSVRFCS